MVRVVTGLLLCFLLSGCYTAVNDNEYGRHVRGLGVDMTFYPVFSIRAGLYEYQLFFHRE